VIYGRSDSTINRHGIRIGTAEIYRVVEELPEVLDSMVVDLEYLARPKKMEVTVRKLLLGAVLAQVANPDAMLTPSSMDFFAECAKAIAHHG
jgi:acetoacetyl-CoA synthetase